ncbi:sporulation integral membrane protein YlbJ [Paraclostridium sordellii]|uniref:Membrane protein n=1 Tax=Paraclostridium sordellii TaxID=1505 RepID=A0A0C7IJQ3_PARSO|nr:sporulation integral membrane protein YlbJ [Paeniclostridium sordellii]CEN79862.1 membrane protein [[Clostridium] sordellii] [Paeniclostridium sordellii]CEO12620.1 membrane protein [[Clostridium] sordellii] [Paeniclostridium sordellii]CEP81670.1 membrane protein [[Clostridium] sordellii] [Paeniclostridium sordellii]CEP87909.1 membrane protein [[Clostridium] sordellii] [Paeniclostridium sordellii]CEP97355.1 membrane protein [[Clostridium] sordellii] [Paeniclostridium sordellii]
MRKNKFIVFLIPSLIVMLLILGIILFPSDSINAAKNGYKIWTDTLIPSLLPFIIAANLIVKLKFIDIIGLIINPITRKLFNVSGKSSLVFAISTVSGYPVGAKLASELRQNNEISKFEAQRLVSFCSTSGPLFIVGAVSVGMFNNPPLGYLILICHYLSALTIGFLFKNYGRETIICDKTNFNFEVNKIISKRRNENKGFFVLFGDAVFSGVNTILMVGGFVIVFSVVFKILSIFNIIELFSYILHIPLSLLGFSRELCNAFISGLFEITIGCSQVSSVVNSPEILRASLCSFLIAFSGLSILAQCCSFLAQTDIKTSTYIFSKFLHGLFASIFTFAFYPIVNSIPLISNLSNIFTNNSLWTYYINNYQIIFPILIFIYILSTLVLIKKSSTRNN